MCTGSKTKEEIIERLQSIADDIEKDIQENPPNYDYISPIGSNWNNDRLCLKIDLEGIIRSWTKKK